MPAEPPRPAPDPPKPSRLTAEELARFGDEEQMREAGDEGRLWDERPPHHG